MVVSQAGAMPVKFLEMRERNARPWMNGHQAADSEATGLIVLAPELE